MKKPRNELRNVQNWLNERTICARHQSWLVASVQKNVLWFFSYREETGSWSGYSREEWQAFVTWYLLISGMNSLRTIME
jgi:hypothetical protein